jgi:drug/metabolite transporter (DMT)-like permease
MFSRMALLNDNMRGALYMTLAMAGFAVNDVVTKSFAGQLNIGQMVFLRGLFAVAMIYTVARKTGQLRPVTVALQPRIALRSLGEVIATYTFITALFHIPIANVSAIMQALPLAITVGAMLLYSEPVGWRRITAVLIGFAGVMVIVRPGPEGFSIYSLYALAAVAACVLRDLMTRKMSPQIPSMFVALVTATLVTLMGFVLMFFEEWLPVKPIHLVLMAGTSGFLLTGYHYAVAAMRVGDIGFVSPFRYSVLIFSIAGGALVYSEYPDALTLFGAAIVVATGMYTLYRERVTRKRALAAATTGLAQ